jgi:hypothetical protein
MKYVSATFIFVILVCIYLSNSHVMILKKHKHQEVKALFTAAPHHSDKKFTASMTEGLPHPVKQYLLHVLPENYRFINTVRLQHNGKFKTGVGKDWTSITGEQYFTATVPGFVWRGNTSLFTAKDMYIENRGRLVVKLFSLIKVVDEKGPHIDQGELLRWLGESVWFPTNLLPSVNLSWDSLGQNKARMTFQHDNGEIYYDVFFNDNHEITRLETERYMEKNRKEKWFGELSEYRRINGIKVPTRIKASWDLKEGVHQYADFRIQQIEYDIPKAFP